MVIILNNCLQQIKSISIGSDLIILQRLQQEFLLELAKVTNKTNQIKTKVTQLESGQFSLITKFNGEVLFFVTDSFSSKNDNSQIFFGYRTRLDFDTSFRGKDTLKVRLESKNIERLDDVIDTLTSCLSVDGSSENQIEIAELSYTFSPTNNTEILFGTKGVSLNDVAEVLNPFSSSGSGGLFLGLAEEILQL